jgi:hypothetical protein
MHCCMRGRYVFFGGGLWWTDPHNGHAYAVAVLQVVVVVNKIDRPAARPDWVVDATFELFMDLGATDEQCEFPVCYASGLNGISGRSAAGDFGGGEGKGYNRIVLGAGGQASSVRFSLLRKQWQHLRPVGSRRLWGSRGLRRGVCVCVLGGGQTSTALSRSDMQAVCLCSRVNGTSGQEQETQGEEGGAHNWLSAVCSGGVCVFLGRGSRPAVEQSGFPFCYAKQIQRACQVRSSSSSRSRRLKGTHGACIGMYVVCVWWGGGERGGRGRKQTKNVRLQIATRQRVQGDVGLCQKQEAYGEDGDLLSQSWWFECHQQRVVDAPQLLIAQVCQLSATTRFRRWGVD